MLCRDCWCKLAALLKSGTLTSSVFCFKIVIKTHKKTERLAILSQPFFYMENMGSVEAAFKHPRWTHWCSTITIYHITVREQQGFERRREKYEKYFLRCPDRFVQRSKLPDRQCISLSAVWFPAYVPALLSSGRLVRVCFCEYLLSLVCLVNQSCSALLAGLFGESLIVFVTEAAALSESLSLYRV